MSRSPILASSGGEKKRAGRISIEISFLALLALSLCNCQRQRSPVEPAQTQQQRLVQMLRRLPTVHFVTPWHLPDFVQDRTGSGLKIITSHYEINTTMQDPLILRQVPVFLESAFRSYCDVLGQTIPLRKKLLVYLFGTRQQWEDFSHRWTGPQAPIYLKIKAGAYYLNGACVAYHIGRRSNFSVLAHECWHQFSDELFQYRLPAWLDEGLATNFEAYRWENGRVKFAPRFNGSRLYALRQTLAKNALYPVSELLSLDAGRVISHTAYNPESSKTDPKVVAYYAQLYALVRFLREDNYGQRLLAFRAMLDDGRLGRWPLDEDLKAEAIQRQRNPSRRWNAIVGQLIFHTYIAPSTVEIESQYRAFCRRSLANLRFKKPL